MAATIVGRICGAGLLKSNNGLVWQRVNNKYSWRWHWIENVFRPHGEGNEKPIHKIRTIYREEPIEWVWQQCKFQENQVRGIQFTNESSNRIGSSDRIIVCGRAWIKSFFFFCLRWFVWTLFGSYVSRLTNSAICGGYYVTFFFVATSHERTTDQSYVQFYLLFQVNKFSTTKGLSTGQKRVSVINSLESVALSFRKFHGHMRHTHNLNDGSQYVHMCTDCTCNEWMCIFVSMYILQLLTSLGLLTGGAGALVLALEQSVQASGAEVHPTPLPWNHKGYFESFDHARFVQSPTTQANALFEFI